MFGKKSYNVKKFMSSKLYEKLKSVFTILIALLHFNHAEKEPWPPN